MLPTKNTKRLQDLLDRHDREKAEVARIESLATKAGADWQAILDNPDAAENQSLIDGLARATAQQEAASRKVQHLNSKFAALDDEIDQLCDVVAKEGFDDLQRVRALREAAFKRDLARHWGSGIADGFFQKSPHSPFTPHQVKIFFHESDMRKEVDVAKGELSRVNTKTESATPIVRAKALLATLPRLPVDGNLSTPTIYDQEAHKEIERLKCDPQFCDSLFLADAPNGERNRELWKSLRARAYARPAKPEAPASPEPKAHWFKKKVASLLGATSEAA